VGCQGVSLVGSAVDKCGRRRSAVGPLASESCPPPLIRTKLICSIANPPRRTSRNGRSSVAPPSVRSHRILPAPGQQRPPACGQFATESGRSQRSAKTYRRPWRSFQSPWRVPHNRALPATINNSGTLGKYVSEPAISSSTVRQIRRSGLLRHRGYGVASTSGMGRCYDVRG
jgi:hypothetical protein